MDGHIKSPEMGSHDHADGLSRNARLAVWSAVVIVGFFILREHWSHALGLAPYLPYVLLLACPLMHLFGHGHHHGGHEHHQENNSDGSSK